MNAKVPLFAAIALGAFAGPPSLASPSTGKPSNVAAAAGKMVLLRQIEQRIVPQMRGFTYLGPEFYSTTSTYRLKFERKRKLVWIDVNARTGEVIGKSGF